MPGQWRRGEYLISTDPQRLDLPLIHEFLSKSAYWALGRPMRVIRKSIENSIPFGVYFEDKQIGFARIVTDYATFAWLADVFIIEEFRGRGLSKWLMEVITSHSELQGFRRWMLGTLDAHGLYRQYGFTELHNCARIMERFVDRPDYDKVAP